MATTSDPHHRKVDLQSPLDLSYLRQNLEKSAQQRLDLHFPIIPSSQSQSQQPSESQHASNPPPSEDPMRAKVSTLVNNFINQTFTSASHSISINGLDATDPSFTSSTNPNASSDTPKEIIEYEPYDPRLTTKVASLYAELENLTTQVAKLRREAPSKSAELYKEALEKAMAEDDQSLTLSPNNQNQKQDTKDNDAMDIDSTSTPQRPLQLPQMTSEWQQDISSMYEHGLNTLANLTGNTNTTVAAGPVKSEIVGATGDEEEGEEKGGKSLTVTMGLVERAGGVARELE